MIFMKAVLENFRWFAVATEKRKESTKSNKKIVG